MKHGAFFLIHKPKNNHSNGTHQVLLGRKVHLDKSKGKRGLLLIKAYKVILARLRDAIRRKRNQLFKSKQWKLLHDNAPAHRAIIVQDYLAKHSVSVLPHPPYSLDSAPCDFFFFPKLKMMLKGRRFSLSSEVIENATVELNKLRKIDFELAFQQLFSRLKKCISHRLITSGLLQSRAQVVTQLLQELNSDVRGDFVEESTEHLLESNPSLFHHFSIVIATGLAEKTLLNLAHLLWEANVPLLVCRTYGMIGYLRIQFQEHPVVEAHPDSQLHDLRLDKPFPALMKFVESQDLAAMDKKSDWLAGRTGLTECVAGPQPCALPGHYPALPSGLEERDEKLSRTQLYFWYKHFKDGRKSIADDSRSGQPLTSTTDHNIGQWKLVHDNAPAHRAIIVQDYLAKHSVSVLPHPPYSLDSAPCDFFFFPKLKMMLKGRRFSLSSEVIENATVELNKLRKIDFELAFQQLFSRWKKCECISVYSESIEGESKVTDAKKSDEKHVDTLTRLVAFNKRAQVVTQLLQELNSDVRGDFVEESTEHLLESNPSLFHHFSIVIATGLAEKTLLNLAHLLWEANVPLLVCRTYGMIGYLRIQFQEHPVVEAHPDSQLHDLRLDKPFPALLKFVESQDLAAMDKKVSGLAGRTGLTECVAGPQPRALPGHYPALPSGLEERVGVFQNGGKYPSTSKEKAALKEQIRTGRGDDASSPTWDSQNCPGMFKGDGPVAEEENFEEAMKALNTALTPTREWKSDAAHDWYRAGGTSTGSVLPREQQSLISRLKSGHLRTMTFQNGCKVFPLCTKCNSQPATPRHIIDCIDSSIDELYSSPADTIKNLKLYRLDTLIPSSVKELFEDQACINLMAEISSRTLSDIWLLTGELPLQGSIPDMISDSTRYIKLQTLYKEQAALHVRQVHAHVQKILTRLEKARVSEIDSIKQQDLEQAISIQQKRSRNVRNLQVIRGRSLRQEYDPETANVQLIVSSLDNPQDNEMILYLLLRAAARFDSEHNRYPRLLLSPGGTGCGQTEAVCIYRIWVASWHWLSNDSLSLEVCSKKKICSNTKVSQGCLSKLLQELGVNPQNKDDFIYEMCRYGAAELHCLAAFIGGCAAQEVIKLVTGQYVPFSNTYLYNAMTTTSNTFLL
ncbi:NAE1 [Cordylochernes scorpioides]|uniref:NAE1 n=1 Tax=Cordylochernes scorpioides TaxID=51811 RepID=A0ABY6K6S8_9ARAC|nr:NAE1 [Cordylochernes scorpioides]